jgi:hypothetical protein
MVAKTSPTRADPLIDEIRAIKESVSARAGHDVRRLAAELRREQQASGRRVVSRKPAAPTRRS